MSRRWVSVVLCVLLGFLPTLSAAAATDYANVRGSAAEEIERDDTTPAPVPVIEVSRDPEGFRLQMLDFVRELDEALVEATKHPRIAEKLLPELGSRGLRVPFSPETYRIFELADTEQLEQMRQAVVLAPGFLSAPAVLKSGLAQLPAPQAEELEKAAACTSPTFDAVAEFNANIVGKTAVLHNLKRASNSIGLAHSIASTVNDAMDAATGECELIFLVCLQIPTSWIQVFFVVAAGVLDVVVIALDLAADEVEFQIVDSERCINFCTPQGFTERHRTDTAMTLAERGCDNRDNNCAGGIDEITEDMFSPTVTIDAAVTAQCYDSEQRARTAVELAVDSADDCSAAAETVTFTRAGCLATAVAEATDVNGNVDMDSVVLTVDEDAPVITLPTLAACYDNLAEATAQFGSAGINDCTQVQTQVKAVEKECVADLEIEAVDECDNRSVSRASVRVDDSPPQVKIERLTLPSVDGLSCFASQEDAVSAVAEATEFSDNCTAIENLMPATSAAGRECNLAVTSTAEDECGRSSSDSLEVRVDAEPPVLSCSVAQEVLWPANDRLIDVGFELNLTDNCDGTETSYEVFVTSDEPTAFNLRVHGADDEHPDAFIDRAADGSVSAIRLRAQRRQTNADDGRVYRIRVVATDSCGLQSQADCFVTVPKVYSRGGGVAKVTNSGQFFDATDAN